jgi:ABC-type nitrate/sulfonate/bicarbonate transport system substrate-binding protein
LAPAREEWIEEKEEMAGRLLDAWVSVLKFSKKPPVWQM